MLSNSSFYYSNELGRKHLHSSFPSGSVVKNLPANAGDAGSIPESGRSPGRGNSNPLQYSCLKNPMDRGAWGPTVHRDRRVGHDWERAPSRWACYSSLSLRKSSRHGPYSRDHCCLLRQVVSTAQEERRWLDGSVSLLSAWSPNIYPNKNTCHLAIIKSGHFMNLCDYWKIIFHENHQSLFLDLHFTNVINSLMKIILHIQLNYTICLIQNIGEIPR